MKKLNVALLLSILTFSVATQTMDPELAPSPSDSPIHRRIEELTPQELVVLQRELEETYNRTCREIQLSRTLGVPRRSPSLLDRLEEEHLSHLQSIHLQSIIDRCSPDSPLVQEIKKRLLLFHQSVPEGIQKPIAQR